MHDIMILFGGALAGGLAIDLQRRLSLRKQGVAGLILLSLGWIGLLALNRAGPLPWPSGSAMGAGLMLAGLALLGPALPRAMRLRCHARRGPGA